MAALDAAHIAARAHFFSAEAGRIREIEEGQAGLVEDFIHVQAGERDLRGGHKVVIFLVIFVKIISELWKLTRAIHGCGLDHERQILFGVTLANVKIEHEGDQSALQPRARSAQHIKTRAGEFCAALEVNDAKRGAEIPVRLWLKIEFLWLAHRL